MFLRKTALPTFIKYFLSYLILFTVLIAGFFYIIRSHLAENYFDQRCKQAKIQLDTYAEQLDNDIIFLTQLDLSIKQNEDIIMNRYKTPQIYKYNLYKELSKYKSSLQLVSAIAHLPLELGEVLSTDHLITWDNGIFYIESINQNTVTFDPTPYYNAFDGQLVFITNADTHYLLYFPATPKLSNNIFFYILDTNELQLKQKSLVSDETPAIALVDQEKRIVVGSNTELLEPYIDTVTLENGIYKQDSQTTLCVHSNVAGNFAIISMLSNDFLLDQVNESFQNAYLALMLLSALGLVLIFAVMSFTYRPLRDLTRKIIPAPNVKKNYLQQLDIAFSESERQKELLNEKLNNYRLSIQKSLLDTMLNFPNLNSELVLPDIDSFFDKNIVQKLFVLKIAFLQDAPPLASLQEYYSIVFKDKNSCKILDFGENNIVFLINGSDSDSNAELLIKELSTQLHKDKGYFIAISNSSSSLLDIPSLYANAALAASYWSQFPVASYSELPQLQTTYAYPHDELNRLSGLLKENQFTSAKELVNTLFHSLDHYTLSQNNLQLFFIQCVLIDLLTIIIHEMNLSLIDFHTYSNQYFELLFLCRSCSYHEKASEIKQNVYQLIDLYEQVISDKIQNSIPIKEIMEASYQLPDFSIAVLADKFQVSVAYMSTIFKKELNVNFSDYLWMLRLNKAKELLIETDIPIHEISLSIGYVNTTSFQRKFKKETGLTPSQFRLEHSKK